MDNAIPPNGADNLDGFISLLPSVCHDRASGLLSAFPGFVGRCYPSGGFNLPRGFLRGLTGFAAVCAHADPVPAANQHE
jgi:hypothetical protein